MYIRIVKFQLAGITHAQYERHCIEVAERFNRCPGLVAKMWLSDPHANTYGGVYVFESREDADPATSSLHGRQPRFSDLTIEEYSTLTHQQRSRRLVSRRSSDAMTSCDDLKWA